MLGYEKPTIKKAKTVVFIDGDYLHYSLKSVGVRLNFSIFRDLLIEEFGEDVAIYYYSSFDKSQKNKQKFLNYLTKNGYSVTSIPYRKIGKPVRYRSSIEIRLATDAISISQNFDKVVFVSGDSDFVPVLQNLKKSGKDTIVLTFPITTGKALIGSADYFINLEKLISKSSSLKEKVKEDKIQSIKSDKTIETFYLEKGYYYDNYVKIRNFFKFAKHHITVIDGYVNEDILHLASILDKTVKLRIITKNVTTGDFFILIKKLKREGRDVEVYQSSTFHDRFIRIDNVWWHLGHSIKDLGSGDSLMSKISEPAVIAKLQKREEEIYNTTSNIM